MPYNVDKFAASIAAKGLASPNKFQVEFTSVPGDALKGGGTLDDLNLMCESAVLAGRSIQSLLDRQYGLNREVAYNGPTYTPVTLTFICSTHYREKKIFDRWNNMVVDISKGYDVAYYNTYIGIMKISALDSMGNKAFTTTYQEAWPKTVSAVELNHSTRDSAARMTVEMTYAYWETSDESNNVIISSNKIGNSVTPVSTS